MPPPPSALDWFDPNNSEQVSWINRYLKNHQYDQRLIMLGLSDVHPDFGRTLKINMHAWLQDALFREQHLKMRAAWRQRQYRSRQGKQMSFKLPNEVIKQLTTLARQRRQAQVTTLRQVIGDAYREHDRAKARAEADKNKLVTRLKDQRTQYEQRYALQRELNNALLKALKEEIEQRCELEANIGGPDNTALDEAGQRGYALRINQRLKQLHYPLSLARLAGVRLDPFFNRQH